MFRIEARRVTVPTERAKHEQMGAPRSLGMSCGSRFVLGGLVGATGFEPAAS